MTEDWRSPDTAPKDGSPILAAVLFDDGLPDWYIDVRIIWWETRGTWTDDRDLPGGCFDHPDKFLAWSPVPTTKTLEAMIKRRRLNPKG